MSCLEVVEVERVEVVEVVCCTTAGGREEHCVASYLTGGWATTD